jgi:hypothetical protein
MIQYRIHCKQCGARAAYCPGDCHAKGEVLLRVHKLPNRLLLDATMETSRGSVDRKKLLLH